MSHGFARAASLIVPDGLNKGARKIAFAPLGEGVVADAPPVGAALLLGRKVAFPGERLVGFGLIFAKAWAVVRRLVVMVHGMAPNHH
jgi:hypothetical protein